MKKIITYCLLFISLGASAQLAPFSRSKGGSISGPPTPVSEVDPLSVKLTGNDDIRGIKSFKSGLPTQYKIVIDGQGMDFIDSIAMTPKTHIEPGYLSIEQNPDEKINIYPNSVYMQSPTNSNNMGINAWYFSEISGYNIECEPSYFRLNSPGSENLLLTPNQCIINRPVKTSPVNEEAINFLETKKLFVSRSSQDTITANKIFTSGFLKINGTGSNYSVNNGNLFSMENPGLETRTNVYANGISVENDGDGSNTLIYSNKMQILDRAGYVPGNSDVLRKDETLALLAAVPNTVVFTSNGTYTPTPGMRYIEVEMVGGGGGSGSAIETNGIGRFRCSGSAGAGAGGYAKFRMTAAQVGASVAVTVGAGGLGATIVTTPTNGGAGGNTSFGVNVCTGGNGSTSATADSIAQVIGASGGTCTISAGTQVVKVPGGVGDDLFLHYAVPINNSSSEAPDGGNSFYGQGGRNRKLLIISGTAIWGVGETPTGIYGAGASGWYYINNAGSYGGNVGSNGAPGIVTIKEYF